MGTREFRKMETAFNKYDVKKDGNAKTGNAYKIAGATAEDLASCRHQRPTVRIARLRNKQPPPLRQQHFKPPQRR